MFLTFRDVQTQIGSGLNLAPDRLLCVVQISGTFTLAGPGGIQHLTTAYEFFDAHTGNYLSINVR